MDSLEEFGRFLKVAREAVGLKQVQVASEMGVSQATVSNWERGESSPAAGQGRRLSRMLGVPYKKFIVRWSGLAHKVELAIVEDDKLTRKEQDALLAHYGAVVGCDSVAIASFLRLKDDGDDAAAS